MSDQPGTSAPRERIGQGLVRLGTLTEQPISKVLIQQRTESGVYHLYWEIAVGIGFCDDETITALLDADDEAP